MARFDVYARPGKLLLLDCQTDLLHRIDTRLVVPLLPRSSINNPVRRLNPLFTVDGRELWMMTPMMASVPIEALGKVIASLADEQEAIMAAIDMLLIGF